MDPVRNPFAPGAGNPPPELAGRSLVIDQGLIAMRRIALGKSAQSLILVGLRGVGKTVLLVRLKALAEQLGYRASLVEAHEGKSLPELLIPVLRSALISLSMVEGAREKARRALRVLGGFIRSVKFTFAEIDVSLAVDAELGAADSGDIEADLPALFATVGEAARAANTPVAIFVDEMQYLSPKEFSALIMAIHRVSQDGLPILLIGAGLPQILGLAGESKSYAERLFKYPSIGALSRSDAHLAIFTPLEEEGVGIEAKALEEILDRTERYPYFLQQWGHDSWNVAAGPNITLGDVTRAHGIALSSLDESFFKVRFDRCSPAEKRYMRALADFGPGYHRSGDIADRLGVKTTTAAPTRGKLIKKGMIYSPAHGDTAFTVPLFDSYMRRAMPQLQ